MATPNPVFVEDTLLRRIMVRIKEGIESALGWVFSLSHTAGIYRDVVRWGGFILLYIYWVVSLHDAEGWRQLFTSSFPTTADPGVVLMQFFTFLFGSLLHPEVVRHVLALVAPYMLIHRFAAIYLADIFEKDTDVATRFIKQAAFAEDYLTIRVRAGRLIEGDQASPVVQIGGPGYVTVELDSAVVLERPDGTMRVIGPTAKMPRGRAVIDDFERLRRCIDLRDIIDKHEVTSRSKDGIIVKARDIQFSYCIDRGDTPRKTLDMPYPFDADAALRMVKGVVVPVAPGVPPKKDPEWKNPLPGPLGVSINMEFSGFIGKRGLSEFFSSIGLPEEEALRQREEQIHKDALALAGQEGFNINESPLKAVPFTSRPTLAELLFGSEGFKKAMKGKGLQVNWVGVGTWETPSEIIPDNHLEAWKTSQENRRLGGAEQINRLYNDTRTLTLIRLINDLPIYQYSRLYTELENGQKTDVDVVDALFEQYVDYLRSISKYFEDHQQKVPENITTALEAVNQLLYHEVGADYYACIKHSSRPDVNIQGALSYNIEVAFSVRPLPGYIPYAVKFDFAGQDSQELLFSVTAANAMVEPSKPQILTMRQQELYISAQFQAIILPGTSSDAFIDIKHKGVTLAHLLVPLVA